MLLKNDNLDRFIDEKCVKNSKRRYFRKIPVPAGIWRRPNSREFPFRKKIPIGLRIG